VKGGAWQKAGATIGTRTLGSGHAGRGRPMRAKKDGQGTLVTGRTSLHGVHTSWGYLILPTRDSSAWVCGKRRGKSGATGIFFQRGPPVGFGRPTWNLLSGQRLFAYEPQSTSVRLAVL